MGPMRKQTASPVMISEETIEQVTSFELLGVTVTDSLRQGDHVAAATAMASKRLLFLKKTQTCRLPHPDLVYYYAAVIRPVMEYKSPDWHSSITPEQSKTLEAVQRQACQIIIGGGTYSSNCSSLKLGGLHTRRQQQTKQEAQLSPRDSAMRRVSSNLANYHATVQKLLIRQVLTKSMV